VDVLSLLGLVVAVGAILLGNFLEGGHADSLIQLTAFVIVTGGTLGAVMVQTPLATFFRAWRLLPWIIHPPSMQLREMVSKVTLWSNVARREGLLGLETVAENESQEFARKGLQLLVDGNEPELIREIMEVELLATEQRDMDAARVFEGMGGYAPTIGIIGAVMGLIHVMDNLADPAQLGGGIAVAFVATIYGVGMANLVLLPVANKLKAVIRRRSTFLEMLIEGVAAIAEGENPRTIEIKLKGYSSPSI